MHCIDPRASSSRRRRQKKLGPTGSTVILRDSDHVEGKINNIFFFFALILKTKRRASSCYANANTLFTMG